MRTREEIEKYRDELGGSIRQNHEMLKLFRERGNIERGNEISKWIMDDVGKVIILDWVLGEGMGKEESVTISKEEFDHLVNEKKFLQCLRNAGVESWGGYHTAQEMYEEEV